MKHVARSCRATGNDLDRFGKTQEGFKEGGYSSRIEYVMIAAKGYEPCGPNMFER